MHDMYFVYINTTFKKEKNYAFKFSCKMYIECYPDLFPFLILYLVLMSWMPEIPEREAATEIVQSFGSSSKVL